MAPAQKNNQKGPQHACSTYLFKHLLQLSEPPEQVIKVPFKTTNSFNSTMMASFLPVIVSKKNKQTKKNMSFIAVYHIFS